MLNDASAITKLLKSYGILTVVDAVSTMFGEALDATYFDILCGGSQKVISAPPGLTISVLSEDAKKAINDRPPQCIGKTDLHDLKQKDEQIHKKQQNGHFIDRFPAEHIITENTDNGHDNAVIHQIGIARPTEPKENKKYYERISEHIKLSVHSLHHLFERFYGI